MAAWMERSASDRDMTASRRAMKMAGSRSSSWRGSVVDAMKARDILDHSDDGCRDAVDDTYLAADRGLVGADDRREWVPRSDGLR